MNYAIQARRLFDGESWRDRHCVLVRDGYIVRLLPADERPPDFPLQGPEVDTLVPGLIDLQVNGGGGVLFNNRPDPAALETITAAHRSRGTTSLLPTVLSDTVQVQRAAVAAVRAARNGGNPGVLGLHIEGPFFAPERRGAHLAAMIRRPQDGDIDWLCELGDLPLLLTLAPERVERGHIRRLADAGVRVCAGHTDASYEQMQAAIGEGLRGVTHLFNAMSPLTAREPGAVGAAIDSDALWTGLIADGHHVHPATIRIACRAKGAGRVFLVSDAMATVGCNSPGFELYGEPIAEREGRLVNADGVLAGSAIGLIDAVRVCHREAGLPLGDCLRMASLNPARFIGEDRRLGRIAPDYRADLLHLDPDLQVRGTWVAGAHLVHTG